MAEKTPKVVVAAVIEKDGKVLLAKEILESGEEYWIIPGGGVQFGESLADAVKREVKEELGLDVEPAEMIDCREHMNLKYDYHAVIFFFRARPLAGGMKLADEVLEARFFGKDEVKNLNLVATTRWLLQKHMNMPT
jgi:ADP-ribose pyrophosphatase YjhB (NUDIX family)